MQSWSGERFHSERGRLLRAVADRLNLPALPLELTEEPRSELAAVNFDLVDTLQLAFYYCARQTEARRHALEGTQTEDDWKEIREAFSALLQRLQSEPSSANDDREGTMHRMVTDFLEQLNLLAPDPRLLQ
jgi:hypothetical protein